MPEQGNKCNIPHLNVSLEAIFPEMIRVNQKTFIFWQENCTINVPHLSLSKSFALSLCFARVEYVQSNALQVAITMVIWKMITVFCSSSWNFSSRHWVTYVLLASFERASKQKYIYKLSSDDNILSLLIKKNVLYMSFSTSLQGSKWAITMRPHCIKSVRIRSYSGPHFPTFGLDRDRCSVSLRIQSECRKMRTRITPNTDTFHAVPLSIESTLLLFLLI